ncbi:class I SAM-dependent DNA methyltransferase [Achromobacter sp.]|uniref:class I SAM-dependent DNA methyltransferase n=1 Tax=Achromobacter sp. TaxID=134375 RepID=UPI003C70768E
MPTSPADNVISLYREHADAFEKLRGTQLVERAWLEAFLDLLPGPAPEVLDIGCGTGIPIARHLIERGCRLTGVDASDALLARARTSFPEHRWLEADMRSLPPLGPFQGLVAWHSFFHLRPADQRPMFNAFERLAAPGAALMFTSGAHLGEAIGQFEGRPLYHGSLDSAEYRELLRLAGFEVVSHVEGDKTCGGANIWLARRLG